VNDLNERDANERGLKFEPIGVIMTENLSARDCFLQKVLGASMDKLDLHRAKVIANPYARLGIFQYARSPA
jgi:hypothetical protein